MHLIAPASCYTILLGTSALSVRMNMVAAEKAMSLVWNGVSGLLVGNWWTAGGQSRDDNPFQIVGSVDDAHH